MKRSLIAVAAVVLAACSSHSPREEPAPSRGPGGGMGGPGFTMQPPIYSLLGEREQLSLTSQQVTTLDSIAQSLQEENRPYRDQLRELRGEDRGGYGGRMSEEDREKARPIIQAMAANNRQAMDAVRGVLSDHQQQKVCELSRKAREERRRSGGEGEGRFGGGGRGRGGYGGMRRGGGPGGMRADSAFLGRAMWSWCPSETQRSGR